MYGRWLNSHRLGQDSLPQVPQRLRSRRLANRYMCRARGRKHCPVHTCGRVPAAGQDLDSVLGQKTCVLWPHLEEVWLETFLYTRHQQHPKHSTMLTGRIC